VLTGRSEAFCTNRWVLRMSALVTPEDVLGRVVGAIFFTASWLTTGPPNQPDFAADAGDMGREKLTDPRCPTSWSSSSTCARLLVARCPRPPLCPALLSRLTPRPLPLCDGDAPPRGCGSRLDARRWPTLDCGTFFGSEGTGGALGSCGGLGFLPGDGLRKVRSVMDPELDCLCRPPGR
jgi:hypothetical protein